MLSEYFSSFKITQHIPPFSPPLVVHEQINNPKVVSNFFQEQRVAPVSRNKVPKSFQRNLVSEQGAKFLGSASHAQTTRKSPRDGLAQLERETEELVFSDQDSARRVSVKKPYLMEAIKDLGQNTKMRIRETRTL